MVIMRFFSWLLIFIGASIMTLAGGCGLLLVLILASMPSEGPIFWPVIIIAGIPVLVGYGILHVGIMLRPCCENRSGETEPWSGDFDNHRFGREREAPLKRKRVKRRGNDGGSAYRNRKRK